MASPFAGPVIDFSPLGQIGQSVGNALEQRRLNQLRQSYLGGDVTDYGSLVTNMRKALAAGDVQSARVLAEFASKANPTPDWRSTGTGGIYNANERGVPEIRYPGAGGSGGGAPNPQYTPGSTPDQTKAQGFYRMGAEANDLISKLAPTVNKESSVSTIARNVPEEAGMGIGGTAARYFVDPEAQQLEDAGKAWIAAVTYRDSGAQVGNREYKLNQAQYLPRAGDDDKTLAEKAQRRQTKLESIQAQGGPMFNPKQGGTSNAADPIQLTKWAREAIANGADPKAVEERYRKLLEGSAGGQ